jgi:uncharacterized repeat protein (TIGR01451 family)
MRHPIHLFAASLVAATLAAPVAAQPNCGTLNPGVPYSVGATTHAVAVGEFNGDGHADLAVSTGSNAVSIFLGNGDGTFQAPVAYAVGSNPSGIAIGEFSGDGKADIAVVNFDSNNVSILLGNGDGTFLSAVNYAAGTNPGSVASGDFNGDTKTDLAVGNRGSNNVSILLGNGNGTFAAAVNYAAGTAPSSVALGDFNGDTKADLVVANSGPPEEFTGGDLSVLLGNGDGTFAAAVSYTGSFSHPASVAIGDFNGDGHQDLVVVNSRVHTFSNPIWVSILLGNGNGTFASGVAYGVDVFALSVAVADFNADGKTDLAVANSGSNDVSILLGNGNGTFPAPVNYGGLNVPSTVAAVDFNEDGKPDLAVTNGQNVSILLAGCPDVSISKTHTGNFTQGQSGATYSLTIHNSGTGPTTGSVNVVDTLPTGLTATAMTGSGWSCTLGTLTCSRSDFLLAGSDYPITLTVNVSTTAPASVTNSASVSGGAEVNTANDTASDPTTIVAVADLTVGKAHNGSFAQGQSGKTYVITVQNAGGAATTGMVSVTDALPPSLSATGMTGSGWSCSTGTLTCTRSDALGVSGSYPSITLTVTVSNSAPANVVNSVTVSGGGQIYTANDTASDPTTVLGTPASLVATAISTSQVTMSWGGVSAATEYQVWRSTNHEAFVVVGLPTTTNFLDGSLTAGTTYLYQVRAADDSNVGPASNTDPATTILFTDDPVITGTTIIKAAHVTELRTAVNAVRVAAGLAPAMFTDVISAGVVVKALHINELRSNLDTARSTLGLPAIVYSNPTLAAGSDIRADDIREIRSGVK